MSRRRTLRMLDRVVDVRQLQQQLGEQKLAVAAAEVKQLQARQEHAAAALDNAQDRWMAQHGTGVLDLSLTSIIGRAVLVAEGSLGQADQALAAGEDERLAHLENLKQAEGRREAAEILRGDLARRIRRLEDERRLNDMADRATLRSRP